jgi:hypothetical protein
MFREHLYAADLKEETVEGLAGIMSNLHTILAEDIRNGTVEDLKAEAHFARQTELVAAELRRRGF